MILPKVKEDCHLALCVCFFFFEGGTAAEEVQSRPLAWKLLTNVPKEMRTNCKNCGTRTISLIQASDIQYDMDESKLDLICAATELFFLEINLLA